MRVLSPLVALAGGVQHRLQFGVTHRHRRLMQ